ncbi:hypothetical protein B0H13DRAFT_1903049 [Mycena leptocephala]|nr:hypothetical protein B0H13DRAFT_1903049 [Mycena leptocephala]
MPDYPLSADHTRSDYTARSSIRAPAPAPPNISPPPHYPNPNPASVPPTLVPQYPPDFAPYNPYNTPTAQYNFRNNFQATYDRTAAQSASLPFRIALGDATNTVGAAAVPNPRKRKRADGTTTNWEANTRSPSAASDTVYHPAITNIPAVKLGSLLDKSDKSTAARCLCRGSDHLEKRRRQTTAIRNHIKSQHRKVWRDIVIEKLKGWNKLSTSNKNSPFDEREEST